MNCIKKFITLFIATLSTLNIYAGDLLPADSLVMDTLFVLRGELPKSLWEQGLKFAVTDPVKNESYVIPHKNGRFEMTVPMRGVRQDMYLYIDNTVTIPVCHGDTINLVIDEEEIHLSASDPAANLDLQLALAVHRKMRRKYIAINRIYNAYFKESKYGMISTVKSDSLYSELVSRIAAYHSQCTNVIDTFIEHNGSPRSEEYFRIEAYFQPLRFLIYEGGLEYVTTPVFISADHPEVMYSDYNDGWLRYPAYRSFIIDYLNYGVSKARTIFRNDDGSRDDFITKSELRRLMAPTVLLADMAEMYEIYAAMRFSGPEYGRKYIGHVYNTCKSPAIKSVIARLSPEIEKVATGMPAPELVMYDNDGKRVTLDDFKGKYVYLDFWDFGCQPCIREFAVMPVFKEYFADIIDRVQFVTVCASRRSKKEFSEFIRKHGMDDMNLIFDSKLSDKCYNQGLFPFYVFIDPEGRIVEFNTARPSQILQESKNGATSLFEKTII